MTRPPRASAKTAAEAAARAVHTFLKTSNTAERERDAMLLAQMIYLEMHGVGTQLGEDFCNALLALTPEGDSEPVTRTTAPEA